MSSHWFEIDRAGLAKVIERRGKSYVLAELCQNSFDAPGVGRVDLTVEPVEGRPLARVVIEDDSPGGFSDLAHAFTLFAESSKKDDPSLRGRFNLGEKLVLALCTEATISSTSGTVSFGGDGRKEHPRRRRPAGTEFSATVRMSRAEVSEALDAVRSFIVPDGIDFRVNGTVLPRRSPKRTFEHILLTEVADADGVLRRVKRKAPVRVFDAEGRPGRIYELGIPVCETGDLWDVDVCQKVPLSMERDSVTPSYLRDLRVGVLNATSDLLDLDAAASPWVSDALKDADASPAAVRDVVAARFGDKVVTYDPSDKEANHRAVALGYAVIQGGTFAKAQWDNVRAAGAALPAGQVTPSPKPFSQDGKPAVRVEPDIHMAAFAGFCVALGKRLMGRTVHVSFYQRFNAAAAYGGGSLYFNVGSLGRKWFKGPLRSEQLDLVLHEFGHEYSMNHLERKFSDSLTKLGADAAMLALREPEAFDLSRYARQAADV